MTTYGSLGGCVTVLPTLQMWPLKYTETGVLAAAHSTVSGYNLHWGFHQGAQGVTQKLENTPAPGTLHLEILKNWSAGCSPEPWESVKVISKRQPSSGVGVGQAGVYGHLPLAASASFCEGSMGGSQRKCLNSSHTCQRDLFPVISIPKPKVSTSPEKRVRIDQGVTLAVSFSGARWLHGQQVVPPRLPEAPGTRGLSQKPRLPAWKVTLEPREFLIRCDCSGSLEECSIPRISLSTSRATGGRVLLAETVQGDTDAMHLPAGQAHCAGEGRGRGPEPMSLVGWL